MTSDLNLSIAFFKTFTLSSPSSFVSYFEMKLAYHVTICHTIFKYWESSLDIWMHFNLLTCQNLNRFNQFFVFTFNFVKFFVISLINPFYSLFCLFSWVKLWKLFFKTIRKVNHVLFELCINLVFIIGTLSQRSVEFSHLIKFNFLNHFALLFVQNFT